MGINTAKSKLKVDPIIDQGLSLVMDFLGGLQFFVTILQPKPGQSMDKYCQGMVFGLEGSKLLVKVANTLINPIGKDGKAQSTFSKKKMPDVMDVVGKISEGIMNTAKESVQFTGNEEL